MGLIVNYKQLAVEEAFRDDKHPMHVYATEYKKGIKELKEKYKEGFIRLLRQGYPKYTTYTDNRTMKEYHETPEEIPPMIFSLSANYKHPDRGSEHWQVCVGTPKLKDGLWYAEPHSKKITNGITVDLNTEADLAFFLVFRSPHVLGGHWRIDDPKADVKDKGDTRRNELKRQTAIWQTLQDEIQLRKVAAAYGIEQSAKKEPDELRFELEELLIKNDEKKKIDPSIKGTDDFLADLKIGDRMLLNGFIRHMLDEAQITWKPDGRYRVGDKVLLQVPKDELKTKFDYICNFYASPNHVDSLQELFKDLITKDYLDTLSDIKDFRWIAKVMDIAGYYNKDEETVKKMVYDVFVVV